MSAWHGAYPFPQKPSLPAPANPYPVSTNYEQPFRRSAPGGFSFPPKPGAAPIRFLGNPKPNPTPQSSKSSSLQDDYKKLFGSPEQRPLQLQSSLKGYSTSALPPSAAFPRPQPRVPENTVGSRWDKEPTETKDKLKELQLSFSAAEKKIQELQQTVANSEARAEAAQKRETQLVATLSTANSDFELLKSDYEVLKTEVVYAHRELEIIVDENQKFKALGSQSEQALLQAASIMKKHQDSQAQRATALGNQRVVHHSELMAKQSELDLLKPQIESAKSTVLTLKQELRAKENQLKETMEFNKKSMSVTAKLNETVKSQEKELSELKWSKGMLQNELKEKAMKIEALQLMSTTPALPPAIAAAPAELIAKDAEIKELKETVQQQAASFTKLKQEQQIRIPWSACKLGSSAKEYMSQLVSEKTTGTKRKHIMDEDIPEEATHLNKRALRNVMLTEADLSKEMDKVMSEQQAAVGKIQRSLLQQQKALREAQDELDANYARKRCLEARSKVLHEQETLVVRFLSEIKHACNAGEKLVQPLKEQVMRLTTELEQQHSALIETQLTSTELEVESRIRSELKGKPSS